MKKLVPIFAVIVVLTIVLSGAAPSRPAGLDAFLPSAPKPNVIEPVTITWWGHATFKLESGGKTVIIDPWITDNPKCPIEAEDITAADLVLVTHDHFDHVDVRDVITITQQTGATVVAMFEVAARLQADGLPTEYVLNDGAGRNIGGAIEVEGISLVMTAAFHSAATGSPAGYIIKFPGGATIYHAGDTGIFASMQLYAALYPMHVALLPMGGVFTMDAMEAAKSLKLLRPAVAMPMHYGTFPMLAQSADEFVNLAKKEAPRVEVIVLEPGESYTLERGFYR